MSDEEPLIPPQEAAKVGTVVARRTGVVNVKEFQRWAAAVGDHNPLWFDPDYARAHGYRDVVCPPLYLQYAILGVAPPRIDCAPTASPGAVTGSLALPARPAADGRRREQHLPPARLPRRRDRAWCAPSIDRREKHGRSGRFVLVTWHDRLPQPARRVCSPKPRRPMIARP